jgi:hypothetical protein
LFELDRVDNHRDFFFRWFPLDNYRRRDSDFKNRQDFRDQPGEAKGFGIVIGLPGKSQDLENVGTGQKVNHLILGIMMGIFTTVPFPAFTDNGNDLRR